MKNSLITLFIVAQVAMAMAQHTNTVIVLDLSDRILKEGQVEYDINTIMEEWKAFEKRARAQLFINSEEGFRVVVIPQKGAPYNVTDYRQSLALDLKDVHKYQRAKAYKELTEDFESSVRGLYEAARFSETSSEYAGVDIWQFFNEQMEYLLDGNRNNRVVVLTDGYMDFEDYDHQLRDGNRYTSTVFLRDLRCANWKKKALDGDYGVMPIRSELPPMAVSVKGVKPKVHDLNEVDRLKWVLEDWFGSMNARSVTIALNSY